MGASESQTIVGGGIAGNTAALEEADMGHDVVLLEKSPSLGGRAARMHLYFPKLCLPLDFPKLCLPLAVGEGGIFGAAIPLR